MSDTRTLAHQASRVPRPLVLGVVLAALLLLAPRTEMRAAGPIQVERLANGLTLVVEERPGALGIGVVLAVRAGTRDDPPGHEGETALLARMLTGGSVSRPSTLELFGPVRGTGGGVDYSVDPDLTRFAALVPAGELATAVGTLGELVRNPRFGVADAVEALDETLSGAAVDVDPDLAPVLWPEHPAGRPGTGTEESLASVTFPDLLTLHRVAYTARNMTLAVAGPVTLASVRAAAEEAFGALPSGAYRAIRPSLAAATVGERRMFPGRGEQATVLMAFATAGITSDDFAALQLITLLLSGPDGRFFADVRSDHGLARDVDAAALTFVDVGALLAFARVQPANVDAAIDRLFDVIARLAGEPLDSATLARLRERYAGELVVRRETALTRAAELASRTALGLPGDDQRDLAALAAVTPAEIQTVVRRYLTPDRAIIHVIRPATR